MGYLFNLLLFAALSAALLALALRPAWREWRYPSDILALPVAANYTSEIDHFADEFREIALAKMSGSAAPTNQRFDYLPERFTDAHWKRAKRPLISFSSVHTAKYIQCPQALFINGSMDSGEENRFTRVFVQGSMRMGANSEIVEWAHADQAMHFESGCTALRRISSSVAVEMDKECCFERMHAPVIRMGVSPSPQTVRADSALVRANLSDINGAITRTSALTMIRGDCTLPAGRRYQGSLIVTGRLYIGEGTEIHGDVKARSGVVVGTHARIEGSLISEKQIQILEQAFIAGPVISETVILIGAHCRLGLPLRPTTVSAENILAEAGSIAHGTVWARDLGVVWSA
jgi:cytoskeletal protein CcmA (bactofilin family)